MDEDFRKRFLEDRKRKDEKRMKNREEKKEVERKCLIGGRNYCPKLRGSDQPDYSIQIKANLSVALTISSSIDELGECPELSTNTNSLLFHLLCSVQAFSSGA